MTERVMTDANGRKYITTEPAPQPAQPAQPAQRTEQELVCDKDPQSCWNVRCQLGKKCKNTPPAAQPAQERNFCPRCGKRTPDLTTIHTCTPPQENT